MMIGYMITLLPRVEMPDIKTIDREPPLEEIKAALGGGWLELVPGFTSIRFGRHEWLDCVAFCDEEGKLKNLAINEDATMHWRLALNRDRQARNSDYLVGPIVVLAGDAEFMKSLREDGP
jgi:hypothetical protein